MSFLIPLALALGLTAIFPIFAHALRKGRAKPLPFPAARLVPEKKSSAHQRHRLQDKFLLFLRVLILFSLALLAASPFVRCSRLALSRTDGASVAATVVIDDSASMRARLPGGRTRLEAALEGARQLLDTARAGDSFAIVLAGRPARVLTPHTTELGAVRQAIDTILPSDRPTDLHTALNLARSLQSDLPQKDRPIVLLSDMSVEKSLDLSGVILPEAGLRTPLRNCALLTATRASDAVQVEVACTTSDALKGRSVQVVDSDGKPVAPAEPAEDGAVRIALSNTGDQEAKHEKLDVNLSPPKDPQQDMIPADDECVVLENAASLTVAVRADQGKAGLKTGAGTVVQAAIESLNRSVRVQTLSLLPDRKQGLEPYGALFVDDPSGFTPETSDAIEDWASQGGVAVALLGPALTSTPLGSSFAPFLSTAAKWQDTDASGADPKTPGTLGPLSTTWADIGARSRALLPTSDDASVKVRWNDGAPFVLEKTIGRGLLLTVSLPASVDRSDLALRPAFLELMDYAITQSAVRRGSQATVVGERWPVDPGAVVTGPNGRQVPVQQAPATDAQSAPRLYVEPPLAGRYEVGHADETAPGTSQRIAVRDLSEHVMQPNGELTTSASTKQRATLTKVGISREIALLALILGALELGFRAFRRARRSDPLPNAPT